MYTCKLCVTDNDDGCCCSECDDRTKTVNNDSIADDDDPIEDKSPGAILPKDLEGDGTDFDYRKEIELKVEPAIQDSEIILKSSAGGIKIWTSDTGGAEVALPATYNPTTLPQSLWIDGVTKGSKVDITLEYKDQNALKIAEDKVKTLVTETIAWAPANADQAYVWSSLPHLGTGDGQMFEGQIDVQGFDTDWHEDADDWGNANFGGCTLANYQNMCNCGALTVISHGGGPTHDHRWGAPTKKDGTGTAYGKYLLGFDFDKTSGTATTMKAEADNCTNKDPDGGREMDGNRVQPSKDDRT